ncbi:MAG TPA: PQQ-binding-like beta-propeller repeat protein [Myxococcota bacterium]|nr:PQQ-binding-like beta-propeller repeat protein [Myxococcota bacterium]
MHRLMFKSRGYHSLLLIVFTILFGMSVTAQKPAPSNGNAWPMFLGNPSRNAVASHPEQALVEAPKILWALRSRNLQDEEPTGPIPMTTIGSTVYYAAPRPWPNLTRSVSVAEGKVFAAGRFWVGAYSAADGKELWRHKSGVYSMTPTYYSGFVFFLDAKEALFKVGASSGKVSWSRSWECSQKIHHMRGVSILSADGYIYHAPCGNSVVVLDAASGHEVCSFRQPGTGKSGEVAAGLATMSLEGRVLYVAFDGGALFGVDSRTCKLRLRSPTPSIHEMRFPVVSGDSVFLVHFPDEDDNISAIKKSSGLYRWFLHDHYNASIAPVIVDGIVYAGNKGLRRGAQKSNSIIAYDADTGKYLWELLLTHGTLTPPVVHGRMIYIGEGSHVTGVDRLEKKIRWTVELEHEEDEVGRSLAVAEGKIFVVDTYGTLYALGASGVVEE